MARSYKKTIVLGLDYSEFQAGTQKCNDEMKLLDAEFKHAQASATGFGAESAKLANKQEYLTQKIHLQTQKVENAKKRYDALMSAHANTKDIEKADLALLKERTELEKLNREMDETTIKSSKLKESYAMLGGVLATLATGMGVCAKAAADFADEMLTLSNQTSVSLETLQGWKYAADQIDVDLGTMTGSLSKLEKTLASASKGSGETADAFKALGLNARTLQKNGDDIETIFYKVIDALGGVDDEIKQDQLAMAIFGKSATELTGVIDAGSKGLKEYSKKAKELGIIMSEDELEGAGKLKDAMDQLSAVFESAKIQIGLQFVPILTNLVKTIASIPAPVLATIAVIVSTIATIAALSATINSTVKAGSSIISLFGKIGSTMDMTYLKIFAVVAIITALVAAIAVLVGKGKELNNTLNSVGGMSNPMSGSRIGHNAGGTQSWRGGATWVGENGPEIVDVPAGSRIYNNSESKSMSSNVYNISMNVDITKLKSVNDVVEAVQGIGLSAGCV